MARPRHAIPTGRRELDRAYRALLAGAAAQRAETAQARLEVARLLALTEGLTALVTRLTGELSDARRELDRRPDEGRAHLLAAQVADLRATVLLQQGLLTDLTRSVAEALAAPAAAPEPAVAAAPPSAPATVEPAAVPTVPTVLTGTSEATEAGAPTGVDSPTEATGPTEPREASAATHPGAPSGHLPVEAPDEVPAEPGGSVVALPSRPPVAAGPTGAGPVEDETVLRLREIRQAFER